MSSSVLRISTFICQCVTSSLGVYKASPGPDSSLQSRPSYRQQLRNCTLADLSVCNMLATLIFMRFGVRINSILPSLTKTSIIVRLFSTWAMLPVVNSHDRTSQNRRGQYYNSPKANFLKFVLIKGKHSQVELPIQVENSLFERLDIRQLAKSKFPKRNFSDHRIEVANIKTRPNRTFYSSFLS